MVEQNVSHHKKAQMSEYNIPTLQREAEILAARHSSRGFGKPNQVTTISGVVMEKIGDQWLPVSFREAGNGQLEKKPKPNNAHRVTFRD